MLTATARKSSRDRTGPARSATPNAPSISAAPGLSELTARSLRRRLRRHLFLLGLERSVLVSSDGLPEVVVVLTSQPVLARVPEVVVTLAGGSALGPQLGSGFAEAVFATRTADLEATRLVPLLLPRGRDVRIRS